MAAKSLINEKELLSRTADGDQRAFKQLYDRYSRKVYVQCLRLLHTDTAAEELLQEIFLKIWRMGPLLMDIQAFEPYLKTLTRNRCLNAIRRVASDNRHHQALTENYTESHNQTEEFILLNDARKILNEAVASLPVQQREVYRLCQQEGLKYEEAAEKLDISINTVKTHLKRAMATLRTQLKGNTDLAILLILLKLF